MPPPRQNKAGVSKPAVAPLQIPPRGVNQAERKRQLNVDAQRRYRQRKRAYIQELEAQVRQPETAQSLERSEAASNESVRQIEDIGETKFFDELDEVLPSEEWRFNDKGATFIDPTKLQCDDEQPTPRFASAKYADEPSATLSSAPSLSTLSPSIGLFSLEDSAWLTSADSGYTGLAENIEASSSDSQVIKNAHTASSIVLRSTPPPCHSFADEAYLAVFELSILRGSRAIAERLDIPIDVMWDFEAHSPFTNPVYAEESFSHLPVALRPTPAQRCIPHHPMLDLLPWPQVRTRILVMFTQPPELRPPTARSDTALLDMINDADDGAEGMKVWGDDPFDVKNWEIGEKVWKHWWWAFDGEIVKQSNRWRQNRGAPVLRRGTISNGRD